MNISDLLRNQDFDKLSVALRDRWGINASPSDLICIHKLAFEIFPPIAGGNHEQPWGNDSWLLWIRNRLQDLSKETCSELLARFDSNIISVPASIDEWISFLRKFNDDLLSDPEICEFLTEELLLKRWLGFQPATDEQLTELESRIKRQLPHSYRSFLRVSNGWQTTGWQSIRILSCDEIAWLRDVDPRLISIWCETSGEYEVADEEYFVYGDAQHCENIRNEYLPDMLLISSSSWANQDYFFLNPRVIFENGEWEAWHFSSEYPGAARYRSFGELMRSEHVFLRQK